MSRSIQAATAEDSATVTSAQKFTIAGYVNTSHGRVSTKVDGNVNFSNAQTVTSTATTFGQGVVQTSTVDQKTTTQDGFLFTTKENNFSYPFTINYLETLESNGNIGQVSTVDQNFQRNETDTLEGFPIFHSSVKQRGDLRRHGDLRCLTHRLLSRTQQRAKQQTNLCLQRLPRKLLQPRVAGS